MHQICSQIERNHYSYFSVGNPLEMTHRDYIVDIMLHFIKNK